MPRKRKVGHPGQEEGVSAAGFYNNPADPPGTVRVDGGGTTNAAFDGSPTIPGYPITHASVEIITFTRPPDVDTGDGGTWVTVQTGEDDDGLERTNNKGGGASYGTSDGEKTTVTSTTETVELGDGDVWTNIRFRLTGDDIGTPSFTFGFVNIDDPTNGFTVTLREDPITGDLIMEVQGNGDPGPTSIRFVISQSGVEDVFDGEWHDLSLHFEDFPGYPLASPDGIKVETDQTLYVWVDDTLYGTAFGLDPDQVIGEQIEGTYVTPSGPVAVTVGTTGVGGDVTTEVNRITVIQDD